MSRTPALARPAAGLLSSLTLGKVVIELQAKASPKAPAHLPLKRLFCRPRGGVTPAAPSRAERELRRLGRA